MRDRNRKQLLGTPAFAEARRRKLVNDQTSGRVIPLPSSPHDCWGDKLKQFKLSSAQANSQHSKRSAVGSRATKSAPSSYKVGLKIYSTFSRYLLMQYNLFVYVIWNKIL